MHSYDGAMEDDHVPAGAAGANEHIAHANLAADDELEEMDDDDDDDEEDDEEEAELDGGATLADFEV